MHPITCGNYLFVVVFCPGDEALKLFHDSAIFSSVFYAMKFCMGLSLSLGGPHLYSKSPYHVSHLPVDQRDNTAIAVDCVPETVRCGASSQEPGAELASCH